MTDSQQITDGQVVSIHYTLTVEGGEVVDSSRERDALEYLHGHGNIVPGLESGLGGKSVGERLDVVVPPADGYGERQDEAIQKVPIDQLPPGTAEGTQLQAQAASGEMMLVHVTGIADDIATVDFNHPLAGKTLHFDVEVMGMRDATSEELEHGHAHGPGGHDH